MTDQLFHLAYKNQNMAKELGFPLDHPTIKKQVVEKWYNGRPSNGPDPKPGPAGEFEIIVHDEGGRDGPLYGGTATVRLNDGKEAITVPASSWSDPKNPNLGIKEGTYIAVYKIDGHGQKRPPEQRKPGVRLRDGAPIDTIAPNPNQGNQSFALGVNFHCGSRRPAERGSDGCQVVQPDFCGDVWGTNCYMIRKAL
ncbi:MAG: hypothetical protein HYU99_10090 [Deltaproteobacteria bacterium]|nr:hypothetical protein [Deltaproteobacteria bacterium]